MPMLNENFRNLVNRVVYDACIKQVREGVQA